MYEKGNTNNVTDFLSRLLIMVLITVLDSCGNETFLEGKQVPNFHLNDALLCHLGHICVPSSEHAKMIWEAHNSRVVGHFGVEKTVAVL